MTYEPLARPLNGWRTPAQRHNHVDQLTACLICLSIADRYRFAGRKIVPAAT